jgi:conjugative relaxase-like TrwC/TraI family protein
MLSIRKVSLDNINYYLALACEDYYLKGGEPPGQWHGGALPAFGLKGKVEDEHFRNFFFGFSPDGQKALVQNAGQTEGYHKRCPAWDLTFSAPKTVSVIWSQAPKEVREVIEEAHREAVRIALSIMEELAGITRRGKGGNVWEHAAFVYAVFEHGTSRAQEPQLHSHAILFNLALRADGTTGAIRSNALFEYKMAVGALYRCALATLLEQRLNLAIEKVESWFEVKGVSPELVDASSTRRKQILDYCQKSGVYDAIEAEKAAIETREVKGHVARHILFSRWQELGRQIGWSEAQVRELLKQNKVERDHAQETKRVVGAVKRRLEQSEHQPTKAEFLQALAQEAQATGLDARQVFGAFKEELTKSTNILKAVGKTKQSVLAHESKLQKPTPSEAILESQKTVGLAGAGPSSATRQPGDHRRVRKEKQTKDQETSHETAGEGAKDFAASGASSNAERLKALFASKDLWEKAGFAVSPVKTKLLPLTLLENKRKTVRLEIVEKKIFPNAPLWNRLAQFKIPHFTITIDRRPQFGPVKKEWGNRFFSIQFRHKFLFRDALSVNPLHKWKVPSLVLRSHSDPFGLNKEIAARVDEALRFSANEVTELVQKIIAVGANANRSANRFPSIERIEEPTRNVRLTKFAVGETYVKTMSGIVREWMKRGIASPKRNLMFTMTGGAADILNRLAQRERLWAGALGRESVRVNDHDLHTKDRVRLAENSALYGIAAGDTGTVTKVTAQKIRIFLDRGKLVSISPKHYQAIELAYAMTHEHARPHSPRRSFIMFEGLNPEAELREIRRRVWASRVSVSAQVNAAARALDQIEREAKRDQQKNSDNLKHEQKRHGHSSDHAHSF